MRTRNRSRLFLYPSRKRPAGLGASRRAVPDGGLAIHEDVPNPARITMWFVERRLVDDFLRIENDQIGKKVRSQVTALREVQNVRREPRPTTNGLRQPERFFAQCIVTDLSRECAVTAGMGTVAAREVGPAVGGCR